jgi:hypothetical protein
MSNLIDLVSPRYERYMDAADVCRYEHALRHSWVTGVLFTLLVDQPPFCSVPSQCRRPLAGQATANSNSLHWPLCASLVLASAASGRMVASEEVDAGVHWCVEQSRHSHNLTLSPSPMRYAYPTTALS